MDMGRLPFVAIATEPPGGKFAQQGEQLIEDRGGKYVAAHAQVAEVAPRLADGGRGRGRHGHVDPDADYGPAATLGITGHLDQDAPELGAIAEQIIGPLQLDLAHPQPEQGAPHRHAHRQTQALEDGNAAIELPDHAQIKIAGEGADPVPAQPPAPAGLPFRQATGTPARG